MNRDLLHAPEKIFAKSAGAVSRFVAFIRRYRLPGLIDLESPPDADRLFQTLEVKKRARLDGSLNQPSSEEEIISGAQRDIVDYHRKLQARARGKIEKLAARLLRQANRIEPSEVSDCVRDMPAKCRNRIDRVRAEFDSKLKILHAQEDYLRQRQDQSDQPGKEENSGGAAARILAYAMTLVAVAIASLALGSDVLWEGEVGSLLSLEAAIAIAIVAVVSPFAIAVRAGRAIGTMLNPNRSPFRPAMLLTTLILVIVAFSCAHLTIVVADPSADGAASIAAAFNSMTTEPNAFIGDTNALKAFGIVMVAGFLGFILGNLSINTDAASADTRVASLIARESREKLTRYVCRQVNSIVDATEKDADRSANRLRKQFKAFSKCVEQARETEAIYDNYLTGLEESCNLLLERYRQANAAARSTAIPPSFSELMSFRLEGASRKLFFNDGIERYRQAEKEMQEFLETIASVRRELWTLNRDTIRSLGAAEPHVESDESYAYP